MKRLHQVFAMPALIAAASVFGLVSALVADGLWDVLSWLSLGAAVAVAAWFAAPHSPRNSRAAPPTDGRRPLNPNTP